MNNRRSTRTTLSNNTGIAPQPQRSWVTRATLLPHHAFLSLLTICVLVVGLSVRAQDPSNQQQSQDSMKQQASDSREVSGFLGDYSKLIPDAKNGDLLLYEKDVNALRKYDKF